MMPGTTSKAFDHILIIMFENEYRSYVMENPYMKSLAEQGICLSNSFGVMHPSQTNYITSISGELCGITDDDPPPNLLPQRTIVDLIEESPDYLSWKAYMESYQKVPWSPTLKPEDNFPYVIKHNPFTSFDNIVRNRKRWEKIDNEKGFWEDINSGNFPSYAWFTPNMWSDGHYITGTHTAPPERAPQLVDQLSTWLQGFFEKLRFPGPDSLLPPNTLVVVTFDEADYESDFDQNRSNNPDKNRKSNYDGPNQIYTVLLGDMIKPAIQTDAYNHYSLLRTVEKNFNLKSLNKNDRHSHYYRFLWNEKFSWQQATNTPISHCQGIAIIEFRRKLFVVYSDNNNNLLVQIRDREQWSTAELLAENIKGSPALAASREQLLLVYTQYDDSLTSQNYTPTKGWSQQTITNQCGTASCPTIIALDDQKFLLGWKDSSGSILSRQRVNNEWLETVDTQHCTDGDISLSALGSSVYLIAKTPGKNTMSVISYNTAEFNKVTYSTSSSWTGPYDDTTINQWSPSAFPVAHFSSAPNKLTPDENEPVLQPYQSGGQLVAASLDGIIYLAHPCLNSPQITMETFSIAGLMTPKLPVSYSASDKTTTNNGFGTLAQAGWTRQKQIPNAYSEQGVLALCRYRNSLVLAFQRNDHYSVQLIVGAYV